MRASEDNDHFMHCHSATSCITTSFIRAYLTHKRGSNQTQKAVSKNRKSKRGFTLSFPFSVSSATIELTSALHCHFFYPFLFHYRLRLCLGPEVQCLGMLLLVWRNPKAVASPVQHFYFIMLSTGHFFYLCLSEKAGVWMCVCTSVCVCVHIMMMPSKKYLYFTICLKSRSHRHYTERKPRLSWLQR